MGRRDRGVLAEDIACKYLKQKGFVIVCRNYTLPYGEIDIVAEKDGITYFVEVRSVYSSRSPHPAESLTPKKLSKLRKAVLTYVKSNRVKHYRTLFLGIDLSVDIPKIEEIYDFLEG